MNQNKVKHSLHYIVYCFKKEKLLTIALILMRAISAFIPTLQVFAIARFVDMAESALRNGNVTSAVLRAGVALICLQLLSYLLGTWNSFIEFQYQIRIGTAFEYEIIEKRSRLPFFLVEDSTICDLAEKVTDDATEKMSGGFLNLLDFGEYFIRGVGIFIAICLYNVSIGVASLLLIAVMIPLAIKSGKEDYDMHAEAVTHFRRANYFRTVLSDHQHVAERKTFSAISLLCDKWEQNFTRARVISEGAAKKELTRLGVGNILIIVLSGIIAFVMLIPLRRGTMSGGTYIGILSAIISLSQMISWNLAFMTDELVRYRLYMKDYLCFMQLPELNFSEDSPTSGTLQLNTIEFLDVSFSYPGSDKKILNHVSFKLERGKSYAIVGENGAGKSTLVKLLLGLYNEYEGRILINDIERRDIPLPCLHRYFACVFQDFARYEVSLRSNLMPGHEDELSHEAVNSVLRMLGLNNYIDTLPDGIDTVVGWTGENGTDLSGGQWQRVAIARALLKNSEMIVLDEPAAALDPISEVRLYQTLLDADSIPIRLFITHRLGCIREVDHILVLNHGGIAEAGSHDALMSNETLYANMFNAQRRWYQ